MDLSHFSEFWEKYVSYFPAEPFQEAHECTEADAQSKWTWCLFQLSRSSRIGTRLINILLILPLSRNHFIPGHHFASNVEMALWEWIHIHHVVSSGSIKRRQHRAWKALPILVSIPGFDQRAIFLVYADKRHEGMKIFVVVFFFFEHFESLVGIWGFLSVFFRSRTHSSDRFCPWATIKGFLQWKDGNLWREGLNYFPEGDKMGFRISPSFNLNFIGRSFFEKWKFLPSTPLCLLSFETIWK